jgi:hypothetical protein
MPGERMKVINLYAGPGAGKSTTAAGLFNLMKLRDENVELVTEVAKDFTWQEHWKGLENQLLILGQQDSRLKFLEDKVDYVITDSPLLLSLLYAKGRYASTWFFTATIGAYRAYSNMAFFIRRSKPYSTVGRNQSAEEAREIDQKTRNLLKNLDEHYHETLGDVEAPYRIYDIIKENEGVRNA